MAEASKRLFWGLFKLEGLINSLRSSLRLWGPWKGQVGDQEKGTSGSCTTCLKKKTACGGHGCGEAIQSPLILKPDCNKGRCAKLVGILTAMIHSSSYGGLRQFQEAQGKAR